MPTPESAVFLEFLPPGELEALPRFALKQERMFRPSGVLHDRNGTATVSAGHRRSRVLYDLDAVRPSFLERLLALLPVVFERLRIAPFAVAAIDTQITATNEGEFFCRHTDNGHAATASRRVSFTYFFHGEPAGFAGGELCIHGSRTQRIAPRRNAIVFFPSGILHEIAPVSCPSRNFRDSRFNLNGWIHDRR